MRSFPPQLIYVSALPC